MSVTPVLVLTVLALALAGPVPAWLARATWPLRSPRAGLVLWQSVALAAVLSAFGAGLAVASRLLVADSVLVWSLQVVVLAVTVLIGVRLAVTLAQVAVRTRRSRQRHRDLVDLLDTVDVPELHGRAEDLRVLRAVYPLAYCLPGLRARVVVSDTTLTRLEPEELRAVLAHERAHLRARHDLVLEAFLVLHKAFPRGVRSSCALASVRMLVELLADDVAAREAGPKPLAHALVACASGSAPTGAMAAGGPDTLARIQRLGAPRGAKAEVAATAAAAYLASAAILVVPTLAVALPWLIEIRRLLST
jgi:Zn-dependent protease with chaperone function